MPEPTPADVAAHLGLPDGINDERLVNATSAAVTWAEKRRGLTPDRWDHPDIWLGAILYASLLYQARSTPAGFPGPEAFLAGMPDTSDAYWRARDLVGLDPGMA